MTFPLVARIAVWWLTVATVGGFVAGWIIRRFPPQEPPMFSFSDALPRVSDGTPNPVEHGVLGVPCSPDVTTLGIGKGRPAKDLRHLEVGRPAFNDNSAGGTSRRWS